MLNNKGQSLVLFILFLPIMMLVLILVIDIGKMITLKNELNNISDIVLDYGLDSLDDDNLISNLNELVKFNKSDIDYIDISVEDKKIYINMSEKCDVIFSNFIDLSIFYVNISSVGYIDKNNNKRIEKKGD